MPLQIKPPAQHKEIIKQAIVCILRVLSVLVYLSGEAHTLRVADHVHTICGIIKYGLDYGLHTFDLCPHSLEAVLQDIKVLDFAIQKFGQLSKNGL